jgi:hypothetical protein
MGERMKARVRMALTGSRHLTTALDDRGLDVMAIALHGPIDMAGWSESDCAAAIQWAAEGGSLPAVLRDQLDTMARKARAGSAR